MDVDKADFTKSVAMDETDSTIPSVNKISNPGYSPIVLRKIDAKGLDPLYEEMGTVNPVFAAEEKAKESKVNSFNKKTTLQMAPSYDEAKFETVFDADNYLTPTNSSKRPPISPIGSGPSPHYADIDEMQRIGRYDAAKETKGPRNGEALSRIKRNIAYEPTDINVKKKDIFSPQKEIEYHRLPSWIIFSLLIIGLLAAVGIILFVLLATGAVESKGCGCTPGQGGASEGTTGKRANVIPSYVNDTQLTAKLAQLESNITTLKERILPQEQEIAKLQNASAANVKLIAALQELLLEEQQKVIILNSTVSELNRLQKSLRSSTAVINETLSADVSKLNKRLQAQDQKIDGLNYNNTIENLRTSIARESIYRQGNDSHLQSAILQNSVNRQISIANLSAELVALSAKISQDIASVERRFNTSISTHMIDVGRTDQNLYSQVLNVNETLLSLIKNISLTPGPVGPAGRNGSGNMSQCVETKSVISVGAGQESYSMTKPPPGNVVVGLYCYASIPVGISFDEIIAPDGFIVKRCQCIATKIETNWKCIIHSWSCPRIS